MKVYVILQHLYDEVKLFEPVHLTQAGADAMIARMRHEGLPKEPEDQPFEWRELEVDGALARRAVDEAAGTLRERVERLRAQVAELETRPAALVAERDLAQAMHSEASRQRDECAEALAARERQLAQAMHAEGEAKAALRDTGEALRLRKLDLEELAADLVALRLAFRVVVFEGWVDVERARLKMPSEAIAAMEAALEEPPV